MEPNNPYQGPRAPVVAQDDIAEVGRARARPLGHGWLWWKQAWRITVSNWGQWSLAVLVLMAVLMGISLSSLLVPLLGNLVPALLSPVFAAGVFDLAHRRWRGEAFEFGNLFAGFSHSTGQLFLTGVAQMAAQITFFVLIAVLVLLMFGSEIADLVSAGALGEDIVAPPDLANTGMMRVALAGLIILALMLPYAAALWFQLPLVYLGKRKPFAALWESLVAVAINWLPMLWYGVIPLLLVLVLCVVAALYVGFVSLVLGQGVLAAILYGVLVLAGIVAMLFLMALCMVSIYTSFRDVFAMDEPSAKSTAAPAREPDQLSSSS